MLFNRKIFFFLIFCPLVLISCTKKKPEIDREPKVLIEANYNLNLDRVDKPKKTKEHHGEYKIRTFEENEKEKYRFEDSSIRATFLSASEGIMAHLKNNSNQSIEIVWNQGAFVGAEGEACGLVHGDVRIIDSKKSITPTIIPKKAYVIKSLIPECRIGEKRGKHYVKKLIKDFPSETEVPQSEADTEAMKIREQFRGKEFRILLPIKIKGTVNNYSFYFKVSKINIDRHTEVFIDN